MCLHISEASRAEAWVRMQAETGRATRTKRWIFRETWVQKQANQSSRWPPPAHLYEHKANCPLIG